MVETESYIHPESRAADTDSDEPVSSLQIVLPLPPHGVNHATQFTCVPWPRMYKRDESRAYDLYVKQALGGWQPPPHTPLMVTLRLRVPRRMMHRLDVDKWGAVIVDAVLGARYDQWVYALVIHKAATEDKEGSVFVDVITFEDFLHRT